MITRLATTVALALSSLVLLAETVADRKGAVLGDRDRLSKDRRWLYNDTDRAFADGARTGKPVLVVLRCIPCLACAGIDSALLLENGSLASLLDRFVCVRVMNANALDLTRFQFDYDLSFSALIFNGDGTLYGRFGSWKHQKDPNETATEGLRGTLEAALALHAGYPANKASLAGKQGRPVPFKSPVEMPGLLGKYSRNLDWEGKVVQSCVHCHQIGDALRGELRERRQPLPLDLIYPYPAPEILGISLAADAASRIVSVQPDSPAAMAGLHAGDDLRSLGTQPLISGADLSWVLHHAPATGSLAVEVNRNGAVVSAEILLPADWRMGTDISRRVGTWGMRAMALGGMLLEDLPDNDRKALGLDLKGLALRAKHVGEYGEHAAAKKAGIQKDDIIIRLGATDSRATESQVIGRVLTSQPAGSRVAVTVLRRTERLTFEVPVR